MIFEYPVFKTDIKPKGFKVISLGDSIRDIDDAGLVRVEDKIIEAAADQAVNLLTDPDLRKEVVNHNYSLAKQYYSLTALGNYIDQLFAF
jgi:hypothetical protein